MKAQMFVVTMIFLAGLIFFVQQALFGYTALDLTEPFEADEFYTNENIRDILDEIIGGSATPEEANEKILEFTVFMKGEVIKRGYELKGDYLLNSSEPFPPGAPVCNDGAIEGTEICECGIDAVCGNLDDDTGIDTCISQGYASGDLFCSEDCLSFDTSSCVLLTCGNGTCDAGECSSGCVADCTLTDCCGIEGVNPPIGELCDDGNTIDCDGCRGDCSGMDNICGDWIPECGEGCDDGNTEGGDGCSAVCTIETPVFLFFDGFETGDLSTWNTWSDRGGAEIAEAVSEPCSLCTGTYQMKMSGGDGSPGGNACDGSNYCTGASQVIDASTAAYINVSWVFVAGPDAYEAPDEQLALEFSCDGGSTWITVVDINPAANFEQSYNEDLSAIDSCVDYNPNLQIRFWQDASEASEYAYVDDVSVIGVS